jgi:hypothetical protein
VLVESHPKDISIPSLTYAEAAQGTSSLSSPLRLGQETWWYGTCWKGSALGANGWPDHANASYWGETVIIIMELCTSSESLVVLLRGFSRFVLEFLPPYFERLLPALKSPRLRLLRSCGSRDFSRAS